MRWDWESTMRKSTRACRNAGTLSSRLRPSCVQQETSRRENGSWMGRVLASSRVGQPAPFSAIAAVIRGDTCILSPDGCSKTCSTNWARSVGSDCSSCIVWDIALFASIPSTSSTQRARSGCRMLKLLSRTTSRREASRTSVPLIGHSVRGTDKRGADPNSITRAAVNRHGSSPGSITMSWPTAYRVHSIIECAVPSTPRSTPASLRVKTWRVSTGASSFPPARRAVVATTCPHRAAQQSRRHAEPREGFDETRMV